MTGPAPVVVVRAGARQPVPWRNGAGVTEEIASAVDSSDHPGREPLWRISVATLDPQPSTFSGFADVDRVFTVVGPHGVVLDWGTRSATLPPWQPCVFDGRDAPRCTPAGATRALNVMTDRSRATARVEVVALDGAPLSTRPDEITALYVRTGTAVAGTERAAPADCLVVRGAEVDVHGPADGLLVRIRPVPGPPSHPPSPLTGGPVNRRIHT